MKMCIAKHLLHVPVFNKFMSIVFLFLLYTATQLIWYKTYQGRNEGQEGQIGQLVASTRGPICETILLHLREKIIIVHPNTIRRVETGWNLPRSAKIGQESVTILREIWHCCHHSFKPKHEKDYHNTEGVCSKDYLRNINLVWYYMFKEIDFYLLGMKSLLFCWQITFLPQK